MKQKDNEERERIEWEKSKNSGMGKFLLREGFFQWGLPMGVIFGIMLQIIENGFHFGNFGFVNNIFFGLVIFCSNGLVIGLLSWRRKKKKYS
ncbi:hypothetical protein E4K67_00045 [Desulfosporosinus fructosivorans]|uniref:Uncharacterized protein n=1 Tax=Desulfosporosinus fructosivorans TaxID=2018669 RepID=A0A4Z0RB93_9FIRM|nr:hypothetical protein [Desulfosporosinus fructosivorans]TGE39447.1 hypothetical protein E4K67_00045 [Desulfosporosinus fructosivorans]